MCLIDLTSEMTAGDALVGAGTILLAGFTGLLAKKTSGEVELTKRGLDLTRESIEAADRPFVIATPNEERQAIGFLDPGPGHDGIRFVYRLWNIGKGPAIVAHVSLVDATSGREYLSEEGQFERAVAIAPAGRDELGLLVDGAPGVGAELILQVNYRSAAGNEYMTRSQVAVVDGLLCICRDFRRQEA
ncbi:MAG TPA: hypothetical protein VGO13_00185 [Solirubrobacterales bacterium]|jgi:hypothetical protein|nr:hypothetical protein [Solirubrobacterales bacterium]